MRGGAFWTYRTGDHYSPQFRLPALGIFQYRVATGALGGYGQGTNGQDNIPHIPPVATSGGKELDYRLFYPLEGNYMYVGPRGYLELDTRANLDLHLERMFDVRGRRLAVSLDLFNVTGDKAATQVNTMVNNGVDYYSWPSHGRALRATWTGCLQGP